MSAQKLYCRVPSDWIADPSLCWFEWQGLAAGLLALGAAMLGALLLWQQIARTERLHREELQRRHNAVRAAMPIALAAISEYCAALAAEIAHAIEDCVDDFDAAVRAHMDDREDQIRLASVSFPTDIVTAVQGFIETLADKANIRHMAELLSSLQILHARYESFDLRQIATEISLYSLLLDVAKVKMLTDSLYNYGRFVDDGDFSKLKGLENKQLWDEIHAKAIGLIFNRSPPDLFFYKLDDLIDGYKARDVSPWNEKFK